MLHREVLTRILRTATRESNREAIGTAVAAEMERQRDHLESADLDRRLYAVRSIIRVGTDASYKQVVNSSARVILSAAYGTFRAAGSGDWHEELIASEMMITDLFNDMYEALSAIAGYRLRAGMSIDVFSTAAAALVEGISMRHGISKHLGPIKRPTGLNGELEDWSLYAMSFEALYLMWFEPID